MLVVSILGITRPLPDLRRPWFDSTMVMSGALIGSAATPEALAATARYPGSLLVLVVGLLAIMLATGAYLRFVARWSWIDSLLAAAPGALSAVISVAQDKGANIGRIAAIQLFRILVLVAVLPSIMKLSSGGPLALPPPVAIASVGDLALLLGSGLVTGLIFERIGVTAPFILGATLASAVLHGTGLVHGTMPPEIAIAVMVMLGAAMGGRVSNLKRGEIAALFPLAIGGFVVSMAVAFAFAWPAAWLAGVPYASAHGRLRARRPRGDGAARLRHGARPALCRRAPSGALHAAWALDAPPRRLGEAGEAAGRLTLSRRRSCGSSAHRARWSRR